MTMKTAINKLPTLIPGFDQIAQGGLPRGRTTLVAGTAGSAKTVLAAQFLAKGITEAGEGGVFITFEETPEDIRRNMKGFGWDIPQWETEGKWAFVDGAQDPAEEVLIAGKYDFGALLARVEHAVRKVGAKRLAMDSLGAVFTKFNDRLTVRRELHRIAAALRQLGVTSILTAERTEEYGGIARFGVEEFVADNVIILRNVLEGEKRRRTMEILKFRGTGHHKGEWPFLIMPNEGVMLLPLASIELTQHSSDLRITSGIPELDAMCGGGFFRDSIILVSGATGAGKTLTATRFLTGGAVRGERTLFLAFEESREQIFRNAAGWGVDFRQLEAQGLLRVVCVYPEVASLHEHLISIKNVIEEFRPHRVAIDSLSALERIATLKSFREFIVGLTSFLKHLEIAALFTTTAPTLVGGTSATESHISTITDLIILLRYVEMYGQIRRGLAVLKMRGSTHDKEIREFTIDGQGMHIGKAFRGITGILTGHPTQLVGEEIDRLDSLFQPERE